MLIPSPEIGRIIQAKHVQQKLPDLKRCPSPNACRNAEYLSDDLVRYGIHGIADELYQHIKLSRVWQQSCRAGSNDLLWFVNRVNLEKPCSPASAVRTAAGEQYGVKERTGEESPLIEAETAAFPPDPCNPNGPPKPFRKRVNPTTFCDLSLFEDLFYIVWHKIQILYQDLQLRYANGWVSMDSVVHNRGVTLQKDEDLTVRDFAWYLQIAWESLIDKRVVGALDRSLRRRGNTETLHPTYKPEEHTRTDELLFRAAYMTRGLLPRRRAPGLKDISTASPVSIVNHVYTKNGIILDCEKEVEEQFQTMRNAERTKQKMKRLTANTQGDQAGKPALEPLNSKTFQCLCPSYCVCRDLCKVDPDGGCLCLMAPEFYDAYEEDMLADVVLKHEHGTSIGEHYLNGAPSNEYAQLAVAGAAFSAHSDPGLRKSMLRAERDVERTVKKLEWGFVYAKMYLNKPLPPDPMTSSRKREATGSPTKHAKKNKSYM